MHANQHTTLQVHANTLARPSLGVLSIVLQEAYATQGDNK